MDIFWQGIIIGFSIAAPVGPIGVLCIRHTLAHGRLSGLLSGLGAATADAFYGSVASFGLTFISMFLLRQQMWFQTAGGFFSLLFRDTDAVFATSLTQPRSYAGPHQLRRDISVHVYAHPYQPGHHSLFCGDIFWVRVGRWSAERRISRVAGHWRFSGISSMVVNLKQYRQSVPIPGKQQDAGLDQPSLGRYYRQFWTDYPGCSVFLKHPAAIWRLGSPPVKGDDSG
jgi:hypothetical protein